MAPDEEKPLSIPGSRLEHEWGWIMKFCGRCKFAVLTVVAISSLPLFMLTSCGGGTGSSGGPVATNTGTVTTNISDPPTCGVSSGGSVKSVWVTITRVRAHISSDADPNASGWVDLVDLRSAPKQIDLLSLQSTTCVLTQLGSSSGLVPGNYQQIRLLLLSNTPGSGEATPSPNNCGSGGFNCVVLADNSVHTLLLSSEAQTGIKVPPGQIAGGAISLQAGQSADINIDFDSCASIVREGNGQFRLKPTLTAGVVSRNSNSISGKVVDSKGNGIPGAIVILEKPTSGIDRKFRSTMTASDGTFTFCPLPSGTYDVVAAASVTSASNVTTTYNATITFNVALGTSLNIPLTAEAGTGNTLPTPITGLLTTAGSNPATPPSAPITLLALQDATPTGGSTLKATIPVFGAGMQPPQVTTAASSASLTCPAGTDCANFTLKVPSSNPQVGTFSASGTTYSPQGGSNVTYTIQPEASTCTGLTPTSQQVSFTPGTATPVPVPQTFAFTGCS